MTADDTPSFTADFVPTQPGRPVFDRRANPLLDETHDPRLRSWVESANDGATDFPLQNLPYGRFRRRGGQDPWRIGVAIGDQILDLHLAMAQCPWPEDIEELLAPLAAGDLNAFMALGSEVWRVLRHALSIALAEDSELGPFLELCLLPQAQAEMSQPCRIGEFTDFHSGIHHAVAVGRLFRPDSPLPPNYKWVPVACHGRVSSIGISGQCFRRPHGQLKGSGDDRPVYGPTRRLEFELELGVLIGPGSEPGRPVGMDEAESQLFGMVLINDWSARDIEAWEHQPLGPFQARSFATTLSPWVVTMDALAPFRRAYVRPPGDPEPLPHLDSAFNRSHGAIDIGTSAWLQTKAMHEAGLPPVRLGAPDFAGSAYWTLAQLVAHHTANGCNLRTGDLLGTGTLSGPEASQAGSLVELTAGGQRPLPLPNGEMRIFLEDGDSVILRAGCERKGFVRIGFGEVRGTVAG